MNHYVHRDHLKAALSIPSSAQRDHEQLAAAVEGVSRLLDNYLGFPFYAHRETRYFTARAGGCLELDAPLLEVTSLVTDADGDGTPETTWSTADYWLTGPNKDWNPAQASPPRPYWELHTRQTGSQTFPAGTERGVAITGLWGYSNQRTSPPATVGSSTTSWDATSTNLAVSGASNVHPGQTLLVDSEQVFIKDQVSTASTNDHFYVERAVNGTVAATHAAGSSFGVYQYPILDQAALFQSGQDYSGRQGAYWTLTATPYTNEQVKTAAVGLHPFTRRMIDPLRQPYAR